MNKCEAQIISDKVVALLIKERKARNVSCYYVSKDTGLSQSTLHKIENFKQTPSLTTLFLITRSLELDLSDIIKQVE